MTSYSALRPEKTSKKTVIVPCTTKFKEFYVYQVLVCQVEADFDITYSLGEAMQTFCHFCKLMTLLLKSSGDKSEC